jgi:uncharacterized protein (TIGR03437 family)
VADYLGGSIEPGDYASIYGTGLNAPGVTVYFGGQPIQGGSVWYVRPDGGQINFNVPASLFRGNYSVWVTNANGQSNSLTAFVNACDGSIGCDTTATVQGQTMYCRSVNHGPYAWITQAAGVAMCAGVSQLCAVATCAGQSFFCLKKCSGGMVWAGPRGSCDAVNCY